MRRAAAGGVEADRRPGGDVPPEVADLARRIELLAVASALVLIHGPDRAWRRGVALGLWAAREVGEEAPPHDH